MKTAAHVRLLPLACLATLAACASAPTAPAITTPAAAHVDVPAIARPTGETAAWWFRDGAAQAASRGAVAGKAKNVILFVGDGMGVTTVSAARIFEGQRAGKPGEEHRLGWEGFPATALSRTYNTDAQTPDSAGTMTAMATGAKTRMGMISVGQSAARGDCAASLQAPLLSLWQLAAANGMATGAVTTTRITHATPAATFSHAPDRDWENDDEMPAAARDAGCTDIARQLVEGGYGHGPDVLLGGGRANFMPREQADPEYPDKTGSRKDGRDLIAQWQARHPQGRYVWNARQLADAPADAPLLGLFERGHMQYEHDRAGDAGGEPSLAEMTRAAISRLQRNPNGFVLLVEGGRIDHAHHAGNAFRALADTAALSDAVRMADRMTSADDTLIVVTADHSHVLHFAGYPTRGNPILGLVKGGSGEGGDPGKLARDATGRPYTTLGYGNGPGYAGATNAAAEGPKAFGHDTRGFKLAQHGRPDLTDVDTTRPDYLQEAMIPLGSETHGGEDVGVWARGPGSAAMRGSLEQNALFHVILQATPRLRQALCDKGLCDAAGVPVELPRAADFRAGPAPR
ncbi:alkaline phosphatase [Thermomonas brevis]